MRFLVVTMLEADDLCGRAMPVNDVFAPVLKE